MGWNGLVALSLLLASVPASAETIQGRWKLTAAEDVRADGSVAGYPWGRHPVGSIVVDGGACYVQIMSSDVPVFTDAVQPVREQMKAALLSTYIAYSGPCIIDDREGSVTLKVEAAWRPDYVGTEQKRFFRFDGGRLLFGPNSRPARQSADLKAPGRDRLRRQRHAVIVQRCTRQSYADDGPLARNSTQLTAWMASRRARPSSPGRVTTSGRNAGCRRQNSKSPARSRL